MLGNLLGGFIVILIGANLVPSIADGVYRVSTYSNGSHELNNPNVSGTVDSIMGLVTIFFALGVMAAGVSLAVNGLRNAGIV